MNQITEKKILVSTIVPAMNEEGNIAEFCRQFDEMQKKALFANELIFVDDGSTDRTLDAIKSAAKTYRFVRYESHQRNQGVTAALETGFDMARGEVFIYYPADLQYKPEDIPQLVQPILSGADVCCGWKQGKYNKKFVSSVYNWISRKLFNLHVHDLNSVKAFKREITDRVFRKDWHRYLVVLAAHEGYRIEEAKIPLYERHWGKSKFSVFRIPIGVLDLLSIWFQLKFLRKPLLYFGIIGFVMFLLALLVGLLAIYLRVFEHEGYRPLLYLVILLSGLGMGFFVLGFVLEAQTALKDEIGDLRMKLRKVLADRKPSE
ncbi:MAG: glycosyltransferase family 2 protein, partial [Candidatus Zixiibacteriota bacterium]